MIQVATSTEKLLQFTKNGRRLGVLKSGLFGEYCWFVSTYDKGDPVLIERSTLHSSAQYQTYSH